MQKNTKELCVLGLLLLFSFLYPVHAADNDTDFNATRTQVNQIQATDPTLPGGVTQPKGIIGDILAKIFNSDGKIGTRYLSIFPSGSTTINPVYISGATITGLNATNITTGTLSPTALGTGVVLTTGDQIVGGIKTFTSNPYTQNVSPTSYFLDTDGRSAMLHNNGNQFYILRGAGIGSNTWSPINGYWPLQINLENNNATFGGIVSSRGGFVNTAEDNWSTFIANTFSSNTGTSVFVGLRARGTESSPSYPQINDILANFAGRDAITGGSGNAYGGAAIYMQAEENMSATNKGTNMRFLTSNLGTVLPTEKVRISANGNVGIGTSNPTSTFHIEETGAPNLRITQGSILKVLLGDLGAANHGQLNLYNSGGVLGTLISSGDNSYFMGGNVGIGNISPTQRLDVTGNIRASGDVFASRICTSGGTGCVTLPFTASSIDGGGTANYVARFTDGDTLGTGKIFDNNVNVGIGLISPIEELSVSGSLFTTQNSIINSVSIGLGGGNISTNIGVGSGVLGVNTTGSNNTGVGYRALFSNVTGRFNTAIGRQALQGNTGDYNTALGDTALFTNTSGGGNTAIGVGALYNNLTGGLNTAIGDSALRFLTSGIENTVIGQGAGLNLTTGSSNIIIGSSINAQSATGSNQLNIGNWIYGTNGNIGIADSTPSQRLDVTGNIRASGDVYASRICTSGGTGCVSLPFTASSIDGGGTANYVARFTDGNTLGTGSVVDTGTGVGIGTATPSRKLEVNGDMILNSTNPTLFLTDVDTGADSYVSADSVIGAIGIVADRNNEVAGSRIGFHVDNFNNATPQMVINDTGKVGIGVNNPLADLHIGTVGDATFSSTGHIITLGPVNSTNLAIDNNEILARNNGLGSNLFVQIEPGAGDTIFNTVSGNVGIGTGTPTYKLDVNGTIGSSGNTYIENVSPTTYYIDTNNRSAMAHVNSNTFYILRGSGATGGTDWQTYNGRWPLAINLNDNFATFGGGGDFLGALVSNSTISSVGNMYNYGAAYFGDDKNTIQFSDAWLRLNQAGDFINGVYTPGLLRADGGLQVGGNGSQFLVNNANGNVGIGTTAPVVSLDVRGMANIDQGPSYDVWVQGGSSTAGATRNLALLGVKASDRLYLNHGGEYTGGTEIGSNVSIPSGNLTVSGNVTAAAFLYSSDKRLKKDIVEYNQEIDVIESIRPVRYTWKKTGKSDVGVIAQEVQKVFPEAVIEGSDGYLAVDYAKLVVPLIEKVQNQQKEIDELKKILQK